MAENSLAEIENSENRKPDISNKATARKIAVYYYDLMTKGIDFVEEGLQKYELRYKTQMLRNLNKRAKELGMQLTSIEN